MQVLTASSVELGIVLRHMAGIQTQVSDLVRQQQAQIAQLQCQLMRMRAQRMLELTQRAWALNDLSQSVHSQSTDSTPVTSKKPKPSLPAKAWQAAQKIICQTGCVGHAHH